MSNNEWLSHLKEGDVVLVPRDYHAGRFTPYKVERVTKTQVRVEHGRVYDRATGYQRGGSHWHHSVILEATPERLAQEAEGQERDEFRDRIHKTKMGSLPIETIRAITALLAVQHKATP
jgi:hypothetical protein